MLRSVSDVDQNPVRVLPAEPDDLLEPAKDVLALVRAAGGSHRAHEADDGRVVLGQIDADDPVGAIAVVAVTDEPDANLVKKVLFELVLESNF